MTSPSPEIPAEALIFFQDVFPDASAVTPFNFDDIRDERLLRAGLGMAMILFHDTTSCYATYIFTHTPTVDKLASIYLEEEIGILPLGSHESAIDAVISGEFDLGFQY